MARTHGTWGKQHIGIYRHPKTAALAAALDVAIPSSMFWTALPGSIKRMMVACIVHRVNCFCLQESPDGRIGHLDSETFSNLVEWPWADTREIVLKLFLESGFVDGSGPDAKLHEFEWFNRDVLRKRRQLQPDDDVTHEPDESSGDQESRRLKGDRVETPERRASRARSGSGSDSGNGRERDPPPPRVGWSESVTENAKATPEALVALWAELMPSDQQPDDPLTPSLRSVLASAAKREPSLDVWRRRYARAAASPDLTGQTDINFRASIGWLCDDRKVAKLDGGQYDPRRQNGAANGRSGFKSKTDRQVEAFQQSMERESPAVDPMRLLGAAGEA